MTEARFLADVAGAEGTAAVRVEYGLSGVRAGDSVSVTLLDFGLDIPVDVRVGDGTVLALPRTQGAARRARLPVRAAVGGGASLVVTYQVPVAGQGDAAPEVARLPVLTVDGPPEAARPGLFRADVRVPPRWSVREAFPASLARTGEPGVYRAELPVVPSVVTLRVGAAGAAGVPLPLVLNVVAGACIALVAVAGWRRLVPRRS